MLSLLLALATAAAPASSYALVVTNNRSLDVTRPDLHYADDDGAKYAELFAESFGRENVQLLSTFDAESRLLYPQWAAQALPPTHASLGEAVARLQAALEKDRAEGRTTRVHLVFAGHGDIDKGQGYLELEDARLTAAQLEEKVIKPLAADAINLILDSCNSYFMLSPRKPGGRRWATDSNAAASLLERYPKLGALVSTSAEAVTYEWSDVQSGIFSYEVRSGMRGAADVDGDGVVSYSELSAFITTANAGVVNDLYRPKVFAGPPNRNHAAAFWTNSPQSPHQLKVVAKAPRRITIRDAQGVRLLDAHPEGGTQLTLTLPLDPGASVVEIVPGGADRPSLVLRSLDFKGEADLDSLSALRPEVGSRGESPVFRALFSVPFGPSALAVDRPSGADASQLPLGVSMRDVERLNLHLRANARSSRQERVVTAAISTVIAIAVSAAAIGLFPREDDGLYIGSVLATSAGAVGLAGVGLFRLLGSTNEEELYAEFLRAPRDTEVARSKSFALLERRFAEQAEDERVSRLRRGWFSIGAGVVAIGVTGSVAAVQRNSPFYAITGGVAVGVGLLLNGVWNLLLKRTSAEIAWDAYCSEPEVRQAHDDAASRVTIQLGAAPLREGFSVSLGGTF